MSLLDRRILMVTGKGGVGKTAVAAGLALAAAARGRRVVLAETSGAQQVPALFGVAGQGYKATPVAPGLWTLSITPQEAIEDYVLQQIHIRKLYKLVFQNRILGPFIDAVPGLHDAVQLGKVFDLDRQEEGGRLAWDTIVVDAPATGHGLTMLGSAQTMMDLTRAGPLFEGVRQVQDVVGDPERSALVLVSLPEEMPVNETLDLWQRLAPAQRRQVACVALNALLPQPFPHPEDWPAAAAALRGRSPALDEAADLADRALRRYEQQRALARRLSAALPAPLAMLPWLERPADAAALRSLGERLLEAAP